MHCTNFIDVSDTLLASQINRGWGPNTSSSQTYSMIDDHDIDEMLEDVEGLPGFPEVEKKKS